MIFLNGLVDRISNLITRGAQRKMSDIEFLEREIERWKTSPQRMMQIKGTLYYENEHDILMRKRTMIGEDGKLQTVENLPNNRITDNVYAKLANQKTNYLLGQPLVIEGKNKTYTELLKQIFGKRFMRTLKNAGKAAINGGIAWLYLCYNENGELTFRMFPAYEVLPFWKDSEHTVLDLAVRLYCVESYDGTAPVIIEKAEVYSLDGIQRFIFDDGKLVPDIDTQNDSNAYARRKLRRICLKRQETAREQSLSEAMQRYITKSLKLTVTAMDCHTGRIGHRSMGMRARLTNWETVV